MFPVFYLNTYDAASTPTRLESLNTHSSLSMDARIRGDSNIDGRRCQLIFYTVDIVLLAIGSPDLKVC